MIIIELIKQLAEFNAKHGNVDVFADDFEIKEVSSDAEDGIVNIKS